MKLRTASITDIEKIYQLEQMCFPKEQAASRQALIDRLNIFPNHFLVIEEDNQIIAMINGMVCNQEELTDNLYVISSLHDEKGAWQMVFGLDTHPLYRKQGLASQLLTEFIQQAKEQKRKGVILTCVAQMVGFYERFGFVNKGVSVSTHGAVEWYLMKLIF